MNTISKETVAVKARKGKEKISDYFNSFHGKLYECQTHIAGNLRGVFEYETRNGCVVSYLVCLGDTTCYSICALDGNILIEEIYKDIDFKSIGKSILTGVKRVERPVMKCISPSYSNHIALLCVSNEEVARTVRGHLDTTDAFTVVFTVASFHRGNDGFPATLEEAMSSNEYVAYAILSSSHNN